MSCSTIPADWPAAAAAELIARRHSKGGWPYRTGGAPATEPTALAVLALGNDPQAADARAAAADWLTGRQQAGGLFAACETHQEGGWTTPLAAMALRQEGRASAVEKAAAGLLQQAVFTFNTTATRRIYGYDASIPGWPWTPGDFSFVEPTALAVLFLKQHGQGGEVRVASGASMLRARVLASGGWNYGEPQVLEGDLFPTAVPTALALLALGDEPDETTAAARTWLQGQRGQLRSLFSLAWTVAALNALGMADAAWCADVADAWCTAPDERRGVVETALCLLAMREPAGHPLALQ